MLCSRRIFLYSKSSLIKKTNSFTHVYASTDYHVVLMTICRAFTHDQWETGYGPRDIVLAAERDVNVLLRLYYYRHGFAGADSWLTGPLAKVGFMSLCSITDQTSPEDLEYLR